MFVLYSILFDCLFFVIPIFLYARVIDEKIIIAATMYFEYILQDRFAFILSKNAIGYIIIYVVAVFILGLVHAKDVAYISTHINSLNWKPVLYYNIALFVLMDTCYGAYYFFEELQYDEFSIPVLWLDAVVIIACAFSAGFSKLNVHLSREHDKIDEIRQLYAD